MEESATVVIAGAGPSGLAISACLTKSSISHILLEKEDCYASLWKKNAYDRLNLHLAKEFCSLPFMPHPPSSPTYLSRAEFLQYIDTYVAHFNISPRYYRTVESASYDEVGNKWRVEAKNTREGTSEAYVGKFLVIATGENSEGYIPADLPGLGSFEGEIVHSKHYKSGSKYEAKEVLVVGCGNSGMEIAYDLHNWGAKPSIVVRSPVNFLFFLTFTLSVQEYYFVDTFTLLKKMIRRLKLEIFKIKSVTNFGVIKFIFFYTNSLSLKLIF